MGGRKRREEGGRGGKRWVQEEKKIGRIVKNRRMYLMSEEVTHRRIWGKTERGRQRMGKRGRGGKRWV